MSEWVCEWVGVFLCVSVCVWIYRCEEVEKVENCAQSDVRNHSRICGTFRGLHIVFARTVIAIFSVL